MEKIQFWFDYIYFGYNDPRQMEIIYLCLEYDVDIPTLFLAGREKNIFFIDVFIC